jgi:hypothetical protein
MSLHGRVPGIGHPPRAWFELIELFSHDGNSERRGHGRPMESHGVRGCMHSGSATMSMMQTTGPVLMGSGPMSKEGRARKERLTIYSFDPSLLARLYSSREAISYLFRGEHEVPLVNTEVIHVMRLRCWETRGKMSSFKKMCGVA